MTLHRAHQSTSQSESSQQTFQALPHTSVNQVQRGLEAVPRTEPTSRFDFNFTTVPVHSPNASRVVPAALPVLMQPKLTIGAAGDRYEQEADRVAHQVVNQINQPPSQTLQREGLAEDEELQMKPAGSIQREETPEDEDKLMMKPVVQRLSAGGLMSAPPELETSIQQSRGSGQPLADNIRKPMERVFGADFSRVKVHTDPQSDQLNQSIQAKAFTTGQDIFFRQGGYNPGSRDGQELIAHELTHVVQQKGNSLPLLQETTYVQRMTAKIGRVTAEVGDNADFKAMIQQTLRDNPGEVRGLINNQIKKAVEKGGENLEEIRAGLKIILDLSGSVNGLKGNEIRAAARVVIGLIHQGEAKEKAALKAQQEKAASEAEMKVMALQYWNRLQDPLVDHGLEVLWLVKNAGFEVADAHRWFLSQWERNPDGSRRDGRYGLSCEIVDVKNVLPPAQPALVIHYHCDKDGNILSHSVKKKAVERVAGGNIFAAGGDFNFPGPPKQRTAADVATDIPYL
ncbi:DUF4157 domain-containing protein [Leptolyngbya sp. FACHB-261]|uniref:eCIS core domain-containing protein n=1 Tax=Leptolyngbya sp. FACHB-261 TaxID=2692806 RepID=UPI001683751E|nr:DUF4157 domain-containing protein [Leptolyngbya sp. FACHB-261]MBD2099795.1 DUF4157 domain-containing protein [Leptolyngbya sp. FACHB-261]